jgi:hypothetical protein
MRTGLIAVIALATTASPLAAADVDYARDIKPILQANCAACHGAVRQKAGLRLDAGPLILKGSKNGPVVVPGNPAGSVILDAVAGKDRDRMPPEKEAAPLTDKQFAMLKDWIAQGAKVPDEPTPPDPRDHWAFRPPVRPTVPKGIANPIDAFLAAGRAKHGLTPNPPADKATLLRRATIDLIGIPPTPDELQAFLKDASPDAYEKVVDRLLASPMYGERWGRHWMDVWRYSDPFGLGEEYRYSQRHIWRWRDWIIESLNADKGYDRMVLEMLAGDEIAPADPNTLRATGYLARNWYKFNRTVWIQDTLEYTAAGFLGITLRCARCHDHKYDPISQADYYRFRAFFEPHDIRIDPVPGQPDITKDGVARAFDAKPAAPTHLFVRGDERTPDTSRVLTPAVPSFFGVDLAVKPVAFTPTDYARMLPTAIEAARRPVRAELAAAEADVKRASDAVTVAKRRLEVIAAGGKPDDQGPEPFLYDTFAERNADVWKVVSGKWAWENGKLVCQAPGTFSTVTTKANHPATLMGRIKYRTTGGGIGSVGFSYDVAGTSFQAVYINAGSTSAVRPFHRVNGQDTYPQDGVVPHPVKFQDEVTLDFAVRENLLNTWVNGKLTNTYKLPVARQTGAFSVWTHDATAEFTEVRLVALPESVTLATKPGEDRPSPLAGPRVLTKDDAAKAVQEAEAGLVAAGRRREVARAKCAAVEARVAADQARYNEPANADAITALAVTAAKAERRAQLMQAEDALAAAEKARWTKDAVKKAANAEKAHAAAVAAAAKHDPTYTPLVKLDPATSTGRRLALARWIADRNNPLTARVAVNHVWMRHFGKPLVPTVANFGLSGQKPTHPELLDWLAVEFAESGWSMKKLHRLIVMSEAYRLSSRADGDAAKSDLENRYLWRANPRRMEGEAVRDSLLAVAGQLDPTMGGPIIDEKLGLASRRRSVYFRFNTEYKMLFLDQFDPASPTECYERRESVIPQQSLALMNSSLALNVSRLVAKQLSEKAAEPASFVVAAFERVLGRPPTAEEIDRCERFLKEQAALYQNPAGLTPFPGGAAGVTPPSADPVRRAREDLIGVLFNHNDFVTVR